MIFTSTTLTMLKQYKLNPQPKLVPSAIEWQQMALRKYIVQKEQTDL